MRIKLAGFAVVLLVAALAWSDPTTAEAVPAAQPQEIGGRTAWVLVPGKLPAPGSRALVVVLHGGLGNPQRIEAGQAEHGLNLDALAMEHGFIVAYLGGTPVTRWMGADKLGWNAGGGCCGVPASRNVDDVGYVVGAVHDLVRRYQIDPQRVFGLGHSNGAMMNQRILCETGLYAAEVAVAGPLNLDGADCRAARGRRVLAIHGADDANVPVAGGRGSRGISRVDFQSEAHSAQQFRAGGATYELQVVPGADHFLDHLNDALSRSEAATVAGKAVTFFGLMP